MKKETVLLEALELAHAQIESLKSNLDDLTSKINEAKHTYDVLKDIELLAELKRQL